MTSLEITKNRLIDRILAVDDEGFLEAIERVILTSGRENVVSLYPEQVEMLMMSEADIENENIVTEGDLEELDSKWMY